MRLYAKAWEILAEPVSANGMAAHFSGLWFSGLSHVQVAAASLLRYLQAEIWIERMGVEWFATPDSMRPIMRDGPAMSPFNSTELSADWRSHAMDLLFL